MLQVATASQFFISYTIRTFGALTFATIMTTRQVDHNSQIILETFLLMMLLIDGVFCFSLVLKLVSIMLSCVWFKHPLSWEQGMGAVSLYFNPNSIFAFFYYLFYCISFGFPTLPDAQHYFSYIDQVVVFGSLYAKMFLRTTPNPSPSEKVQTRASSPVKGIPL